MTAEKNLPVTKAPSTLATEAVPDFLQQYGGAGNENVTRNDMVLPRLGLLQGLSPQLKRTDPSYIEGAQQGDIFNTVTGDLYANGVCVVNCFFVKEWAVFKKRTAGGGFRGTFPTEKEANAHMAALPEVAECEVIEQALHYILVLDEDKHPISEAALVFASTKLKVSRKWNSLIALQGEDKPRFTKIWKLSSVPESNAKGDFYNYAVSPAGFITEEIAIAANALYAAVKEGTKTVDRAAAQEEAPLEY
jgi:hypothetical protein